MKLMLLGAPGAGKGTQAEYICKALGIPAISTGNILREAIKNGTALGLEAKKFMDEGKLVPDATIIGVISERLGKDDCANGFLLDGVPRTIAQADALGEMGIELDCALSIEVPDEFIERRMGGRRVCPVCGASFHVEFNAPKAEGICDQCGAKLVQRPDDAPETVRGRLKVYHEQTGPLKEYYAKKGILKSVDGRGDVESTRKLVFEALGI